MKHEKTAMRLRKALDMKGIQAVDLAARSGVSQSSISQYMNGSHKPSNISSGKMAAVLNVDPVWLMGFDVPMGGSRQTDEEKNAERIPILGRVAAGIPIEAIEDIYDYEEIPEEMKSRGEYFGLLIKGDSMTPDIRDGDVVIVRKQPDAETGETVVATVNGNDACCKRLMKYAGGIQLLSINPAYPPMMFTDAEIESLPVSILGRVVELRRKM